MKNEITITRHQMAEKCSDALKEVYNDEPNLSMSFMKALMFSGLIIALCFKDEEGEE